MGLLAIHRIPQLAVQGKPETPFRGRLASRGKRRHRRIRGGS